MKTEKDPGTDIKQVIGIDKGKTILIARENYPCIRFEQLDGFDVSSVLKLGKQFSKIYIDISGNRDPADVLRMIRKYEAAFNPELIVVKSSKLLKMLRKFTVWAEDGSIDT